uniref:SAM-dependent MTase RsmB/NOP-type domain-containing protein n=1 Tax=Globisporangium ultimum (strain ATCC 200006 / CBS 805.95 / DAOM BR144) TaxID=431595 RepID=K3WGW8_GLOUD
MGKRKDFRNKRGNFSKKSRKDRDAAGAEGEYHKKEDNFTEWVYTNDNFIKYYQAQGVVPEAEWEQFMKFLATPLPTTFRINNSCPFAERIRERIATDFKYEGLVLDDGEEVAPIAPMPWYPNQKGFQWSVERRKVRKLPILAEFQKWLVELTLSGATTRQEAVSMIPPLILDVQPHHKVLDMCAAPGSKTSQLLESLHAQEHVTGETPTGMVMANDIDIKRAYMLVHQSKRIGSPALIVTCHEAQHIPYVGEPEKKSEGFFDRILCDAPCSGDGTLRKNPIIWKQWDARNGIALHPLQVEISKRGASLLKVGGYMCYSTCTFNPLENEAIVAELLRWSKGALELVDVSDRLPLLKRRSGVSSWKVLDSAHTEFTSFEHFVEENKKQRNKNKITATMFPPSADETAAFHLERCMRCVPHDENTGGFFICLLKKTAPTPEEDETVKHAGKKYHRTKQPVVAVAEDVVVATDDAAADEAEGAEKEDEAPEPVAAKAETVTDDATDAAAATAAPAESTEAKLQREPRRSRYQKPKGDEYLSFDDQWKSVQEYYEIDEAFSGAQLITRSDDAKAVTFVTKSITYPLIEEMKAKKFKLVYAGLKMFERNETKDANTVYRLCQAGVPHVLSFMGKRKITVSKHDFQMLLERLGELFDYSEFEPATQKVFEDAPIGSIVCSLENTTSLVEQKIMNIVVWRGRNSVNAMATKADAVVILSAMKELKLFDDAVSAAIAEAKAAKHAERAARDVAVEQAPAATEAAAPAQAVDAE